MAGWKIHNFNRKYIFNPGSFSSQLCWFTRGYAIITRILTFLVGNPKKPLYLGTGILGDTGSIAKVYERFLPFFFFHCWACDWGVVQACTVACHGWWLSWPLPGISMVRLEDDDVFPILLNAPFFRGHFFCFLGDCLLKNLRKVVLAHRVSMFQCDAYSLIKFHRDRNTTDFPQKVANSREIPCYLREI